MINTVVAASSKRFIRLTTFFWAVTALGLCLEAHPGVGAANWAERMRAVHSHFTGTNGTFAQFGDSITFSMAFWAPLETAPKKMNAQTARAYSLVKQQMNENCWRKWKGPEFGSQGSMTVRWARENINRWLKELNPETAVIMFGSNDVAQMDVNEYEEVTRQVVRRCLDNGTIVLLTTAPPRSGRLEKSEQFARVIRKIAAEEKVPLVNFFGEILRRRPRDWDGSLPQFKTGSVNVYEVPTLISGDGVHPSNPAHFGNDFSEEGLRHNGFALRNYLTLVAYAEVIDNVLRAREK